MKRQRRWLLAVAVLAAACTPLSVPLSSPLWAGIAATEITDTSAVVWAKGEAPGTMIVSASDPEGQTVDAVATLATDGDYTGQVAIDGLAPATRYTYTVRLEPDDGRGSDTQGSFQTAPAPAQPAQVRFAFGADLAGQNVCRDANKGFPIFASLRDLPLDFFVGLGDMIYADDLCNATGALGNAQVPGEFPRAESVADFHAHWRYTLADPGLQALRSRTGYYAVWDDHEVVNDFGPGNDRRTADGPSLMAPGLRAFLDYNPVQSADADRLYRSFRHGANAELFLLDTRRYRDHNEQPDLSEKPKSMLGSRQREWLIDGVTTSDATWKFIVSSVPLSLPTGWPRDKGRDGWANDEGPTGFENELVALLREFQRAGVRNLVWLSADVHFATGFAYSPFADDENFTFHEFVVGPLNAGLYPTQELDTTLRPQRLYFHGPAAVGATHSFEEATGWFNLGVVHIERDGTLGLTVVNGYGETVSELTLAPVSD
ncbi:MAG: alkaline phosphatase D family protein [Pseudomonadota bacterium]